MSSPSGVQSGRWTKVVLLSAALLVLPIALWLLFPVPELGAPRVASSAPSPISAPESSRAAPLPVRTIEGTVRSEAGAPVAGARVEFRDLDGKRSLGSTTTGADGAFSLPRAPLGEGTLNVEKEGFATATEAIEEVDEPEDVHLEIVLAEARWITGVVVAPNGRPVAEASVGCDDRDDPLLGAQTDGNGRFSLPPEAEGCSGFAEHPAWGPSELIRLTAGAEIRLELTGPGSIAGNVVDEAGRAVPSFLIAIESFVPAVKRDIPNLKGRARSVDDPQGAFEWTELAAGTYIFTASAPGRPPAQSDPVELAPGEHVDHVRIVLLPGAVLTGTVIDRESHAPISGASVGLDAATNTTANGIGPVITDEQGGFTLEGVPNGRFSLKVSHDDYRVRIVTGLDGSGTPKLTQTVELERKTEEGGDSEFGGVGAVLAPRGGRVVVAGVVKDSPAAEAGIQRGDAVVRIDGESAEELTLMEVLQRIRGPEGSRVTVTFDRDGETYDVTLTRTTIVR